MSDSDRAEISARIDAWLTGHAWRSVRQSYSCGYHIVTFKDERGKETTLVSADCREDAARLFLDRRAA